MATSPNYSWPEPDNTDLVKNGALAMRTLGNAIDTTMATMTPKSTVTAKGSLIAATAASTPANLAVGNNGETLVADSSTSTGLRYTAGNPIPNPVLNSAMQVWQRGTSIACSTTAYTADRWQGYRSVAGGTVSRQVTGDTTNLPNIQYCARVQRDSGNTSTATIYLAQSMETVNSIPYAGKSVTFSYYARKGANFSGSGALRVTLQQGAGTDQNVLTSMASSTVVDVNATLTTSWQRFSGTGTVNTTSTQLGFYVDFNPTGTAGAADYVEITGVQIDIGSVALPFRTYAATIQAELAACQRYYVRFNAGNGYGNVANSGYTASSTSVNAFFQFPVNLRTIPTAIDSSNVSYLDSVGSGTTVSSPSSAASGVSYANVGWTTSSATAGRFCWLRDSAGAGTGYVGFSAEL